MYKQERKCLKILHDFTISVIVSRQCELASKLNDSGENRDNELGIRQKTALLDLLLQSTIDGKPLTNEDIREEVDTFMFEVSGLILHSRMMTIKILR